jgi:hypothetical protein
MWVKINNCYLDIFYPRDLKRKIIFSKYEPIGLTCSSRACDRYCIGPMCSIDNFIVVYMPHYFLWVYSILMQVKTLFITLVNLAQAIQHYVIKFASDLWQIRVFLCAHRFPPPIKLTPTI